MAGTVTITESSLVHIHKIKWTWTSTAGGAADLITAGTYAGRVVALVTIPAAAGSAPTDNYDITITDAEGFDVMQAAGANRDTANTEQAVPTAESVAFGPLTLNIANAGSAKGGVAILYIQGVKLGG